MIYLVVGILSLENFLGLDNAFKNNLNTLDLFLLFAPYPLFLFLPPLPGFAFDSDFAII
jgi:hypothetical protein